MRNNLQNDVKIEKSKQSQSKFDLSGSVSSTANIGEVSVLFSRTLQPYSKAMCGTEQLVRMAPLVAPTYAKQHYKTWHTFIPIQDVWSNYGAFMTKGEVSRNGQIIKPSAVPSARGWQFAYWCLNGAKATVYVAPVAPDKPYQSEVLERYFVGVYPSTETWYKKVVDYVVTNLLHFTNRQDGSPVFNPSAFSPAGYKPSSDYTLESGNYNGDNIGNMSFAKYNPNYNVTGLDELSGYDVTDVVPLDSADLVLFTHLASSVIAGSDCAFRIAVAFRFSSWGMHLAKIFRGLGYPIDFDDNKDYSILPLVATYQAYWNIFGLEQWMNFETTWCSRLQSLYENQQTVDMLSNSLHDYFNLFIREELGAMWVTERKDYVSAHLPQPTIAPSMSVGNDATFVIADVADPETNPPAITSPDTTSEASNQPDVGLNDGHAYMRRTNHGYMDSELLKRMYKRTNVNTALGRNIQKQLQALGLGDFMQRIKTHYIGDTDVVIDVSSVTSTSDTFDSATSEGKMLGSYGGKGVGYGDGKKKLWYRTGEDLGYWIALDAVTVDAGYSQGVDLSLQATKQVDFPQSDYEGVGLELHPKSVVNGSRDVGTHLISNYEPSMSAQPYGFATRYSPWKVGRNTLNGGFAQKSTRDTFIPYNMDKLLYPDELETFRLDGPGTESWFPNSLPADSEGYVTFLTMHSTEVPTAGNPWCYLGRFYWLANLLRIFAQQGKKITYNLTRYIKSSQLAPYFEYHYRTDDNYILLTDVWFKAWMPLLPIEETYGTVDPDRKALEYIERC